MKRTWTAEGSRMKGSVQLGLLCLSLLISSLHGEVETDTSMHMPLNLEEPDQSMEYPFRFEEPDLHQPEMYRVRRQTVSTEKEDTAKTEVVVTSSENGKIMRRKRPHPGAFTLLGDSKDSEVKLYRTKRQSKSKGKKKGTHRPGRYSLLAMGAPLIPKPVRAKRDTGHWPGR
ncbi:uncharacterized protein ackr4a isoform X2 [Megalobrama amblycephala]|uniref:uncharacterized protein ackr4a isoform X2 n=1 Tax=Megalobrama amblycephala TaxID=75352 RepID=UPI002014701E|nr:uncharacterized protein ackr4a isoform X2 [Megalobrama amblycephala]